VTPKRRGVSSGRRWTGGGQSSRGGFIIYKRGKGQRKRKPIISAIAKQPWEKGLLPKIFHTIKESPKTKKARRTCRKKKK